MLGTGKVIANGAEVNMVIPSSGEPVPFSHQECDQLAAVAEDTQLASLQCGDDDFMNPVLFCLVVLGALVLIDGIFHSDEEETD